LWLCLIVREKAGDVGISVVVCNERPLVRAGLCSVLSEEPDLEVVGQFADGRSASARLPELNPAVMIADPAGLSSSLGKATGELVDSAVAHSVAVIVLAEKYDMDCVSSALRAGAVGFLLNEDPPEQIAYGIRMVAAGKALLSPAVTSEVIAELAVRPAAHPHQEPDPRVLLTRRELEVLQLLSLGLPVSEVAKMLFVAKATVRSHVHHLLGKLGLERLFQAVALAHRTGLVPASTPVEPRSGPVNTSGRTVSTADRRLRRLTVTSVPG
jgi:DNA-binding NarL/FixJ family response regulator